MITMLIVYFVYECVHNLSPAYFSNYLTWFENVHSFVQETCLHFVAIQLNMNFDLSVIFSEWRIEIPR